MRVQAHHASCLGPLMLSSCRKELCQPLSILPLAEREAKETSQEQRAHR